jgi:hypothetical protein
VKEKYFNDTALTEAERQYQAAIAEQEEFKKKKEGENEVKLKKGGIVKNPCNFGKIKKLMKK